VVKRSQRRRPVFTSCAAAENRRRRSFGAVTLLGVWVSDGVSGRDGVCAQSVVDKPAVPVTCSQMAKRMVISAQ
jgi:hypothetical protein